MDMGVRKVKEEKFLEGGWKSMNGTLSYKTFRASVLSVSFSRWKLYKNI